MKLLEEMLFRNEFFSFDVLNEAEIFRPGTHNSKYLSEDLYTGCLLFVKYHRTQSNLNSRNLRLEERKYLGSSLGRYRIYYVCNIFSVAEVHCGPERLQYSVIIFYYSPRIMLGKPMVSGIFLAIYYCQNIGHTEIDLLKVMP